jgi:hypothetical protein
MYKGIAAIWISLVIIFSAIVIINDTVPKVKGTTFTVDDDGPADFTTIQEAVDAAISGDTIFVFNGTYYENVVVNKTINLTGENKNDVIIDGEKNGPALLIKDIIDVSISSLSIHNGSSSSGSLNMDNASCTLSNCNVNGSQGDDSLMWAENGSPGVSSTDSIFFISNSTIYGGAGGDYIDNTVFSQAGDGGEGITLINTNAKIADSYIKGGRGGQLKDQDPWWDDHVGENGDGNNAILIEESGLEISFCDIRSGSGKQSGNFYTQAGNCIEGTNSNLTVHNNYFNAEIEETGNAIIIDNLGSTDNKIEIKSNEFEWCNIGLNLIGVTNSTIERNLIDKCFTGIKVSECSPQIVNSTISMSLSFPLSYVAFDVGSDSHPIAINTTYGYGDLQISPGSDLTIAWFVSVEVKNQTDVPVEDAVIYINDTFGSNVVTKITGSSGLVEWIPVNESFITSNSIINYTPHYVSALKNTMFGYIFPNQSIDQNRNFIIVLNLTSYFQEMEPGWNLVSIPLSVWDTSLPEIFKEINGEYNAVQIYNTSSINDPWKHYHTTKPSQLQDLHDIDHTMGFWIHIIKQEGSNLIIIGNLFISNQTITLRPGWNLVGYPSHRSHNRTAGLNNLAFGPEIDAIQWFDSSTKTWHFLEEGDFFVPGRGYWIHSKVETTWKVPI